MARKKGVIGALDKMTSDKVDLNKKVLKFKKSLDEVTKILNNKGKDTK
ncbi:MAG TPA: hypothetical protein IAC41_07960 [Candidatus Merdenecus merdavium]|nr:hypothetical protein [Candidatus Merdenecus merdavium]